MTAARIDQGRNTPRRRTRRTRRRHRFDTWRLLFASTLLALVAAKTPWANSVPFHARFVLGGALLGHTLLRWPPQVPVRRYGRFLLPLGLFIMSAAMSVLWTEHQGIVATQVIGAVIMVGTPCVAMLGRWQDPKRLRGDLTILFVVLSAVAVVGLIEGTTTASGRFSGIYGNPNTYSMMGALICGLGFGVVRSVRRPWWVQAAIILTALGMLYAEGRAGLLALTAILLVAAVRARRGRRILIGLTSTAVFVACTWTLIGAPLPAPLIDTTDRFARANRDTSRELAWDAAVGVWRERPLEGHGFRAGEAEFIQARETGNLRGFTLDGAHNGYLQVLLECGAIGLALLVCALVPVVASPRPRSRDVADAWLGAYAATIGGLTIQIAESSIFGVGSPFTLAFWTCVCATTVLGQARRRGKAPPPGQGRGRVRVPELQPSLP